ncbi:ComGF family competence protein [Facklamia miroungae]|uniref:Putative Competence protein ComGF n=1 Tax=Facklamia miroungae TaxID=120956 RepID=A0A1G7U4D4_9LACT|nr:ComGF family competence protein [Facklamia miroungae]NKZ29877.1 ComGF family competence protein [Facklamia miroungae]SDG41620.1 Putative Competence protein ComGF [Facklamia miroungae]
MHTLMISIKHYQKIDQNLRHDRTFDWQHFTLIMESEFEHFLIERVTQQEIHLCLKSNVYEKSSIVLKNKKIYRRPGHHPYLYHVKSWDLVQNEPFITISVQLTNDQVFAHTFHTNFDGVDEWNEK